MFLEGRSRPLVKCCSEVEEEMPRERSACVIVHVEVMDGPGEDRSLEQWSLADQRGMKGAEEVGPECRW